MRDDGQESGMERGGLKVHTMRTARFAALMSAAGKPEVYLPLSDPKQDRSFMKAVKEHRVLSIRQEPTSKRTDFGVVGFDDRKHTSYLVFPKSLSAFGDARIIGIKYDVIGGSPMVASGPLKAPARKILPPSHRTQASKRPAHAAIQKTSAVEARPAAAKGVPRSPANHEGDREGCDGLC